jgi:hypothetical protein
MVEVYRFFPSIQCVRFRSALNLTQIHPGAGRAFKLRYHRYLFRALPLRAFSGAPMSVQSALKRVNKHQVQTPGGQP